MNAIEVIRGHAVPKSDETVKSLMDAVELYALGRLSTADLELAIRLALSIAMRKGNA